MTCPAPVSVSYLGGQEGFLKSASAQFNPLFFYFLSSRIKIVMD